MGLRDWERLMKSPEIPSVLLQAAEVARAARSSHVQDAHIVAALLRNETVRAALSTIGVDLATAAEALVPVIDDLPKRKWYDLQRFREATQNPLLSAAARATAGGLKELTVCFVFATVIDVTQHRPLVDALESARFSLLKFRWYLSHGMAADAPPPRPGPVRVVLYDDPFTTMDFVVEVLRDVFGRDEETARALMLRVHEEGSAALATMDATEALAKLARVRERADPLQMPLRITACPCI